MFYSILSNEIKYTDYEIYVGDIRIDRAKKDASISHLNSVFGEINTVSVRLFNDNEEVVKARFYKTSDLEGTLITY